MPALVNIKVGSLRGTSDEDATTSWPLRVKKSRKPLRISLTPLILECRATICRYGPNRPLARCFQGLFSGGGGVSLGRAQPNHSGLPQNAFAPVFGGGRFMQPGADGGER